MRDDLGHVVIDRPRYGSRQPNKATRERVSACDTEAYDVYGQDNGWRRAMHIGCGRGFRNQGKLDGKELSDRLSPLRRLLYGALGQRVDDLRSALAARLPRGREPFRHVLEVHFEGWLSHEGVADWRYTPFIVDDHGQLQRNVAWDNRVKRTRKRKRLTQRDRELKAKPQLSEHERRVCCIRALHEHKRKERDRVRRTSSVPPT